MKQLEGMTERDVQIRDLEADLRSLEANKLREANRQLVQAFNQNEKLVNALYEAREQITSLKEEVDKLCAPPSTYGVYLSVNEDGTVNILSQGRKVKVNLHPSIRAETLKPGQELVLNEGLNVVEAAGYEIQDDVVILKEQLDDERAVVTLRADEEKVGIIADPLRLLHLKTGERLDVKIKIERPDQAAALDIFAKYLTTEIPIAESETRAHGGDTQGAIDAMITQTIDSMYSLSEENRFLEVTYANGDKEVLYFKDFASGAMIESIVRRAKKLALKRYIGKGEKGITLDDLLTAVREEFKENEDLPNTTNPDDWAKIAGKKGERIVYVKPLISEPKDKLRDVEKIVTTGQYL